jgi:eukaryotic-like serine/threonine-protein kinase
MSTPGILICPACRVEGPGDALLCSSCGCGLSGVLRKGEVIGGRYEVFAPLGRGGMGIVYRAHDRVLDEPVAMKVLRSDFEDSIDLTQRFRAEIKLARKVSHRNVCRIHEYGEDGQVHYICMELVSGTDLRTLLKDRRLGMAEAFDASIQVGLGLEAIHEMGVIHRDLKTSNIMKDHRGVVRLMDFGIAKQWGAGTAAGVTLAGQIIGTPEYMSPEQARGEKIDLRSDIYALGIVLFEIFTGHVPFHAPTPLATIFQHLQSPPPLRGPEAEGIPESLIPVLHRALAKDPADRHQTVAEVIADLRQARSDTLGEELEIVTPRPPTIDRTLPTGPPSPPVPFPTPPSFPGRGPQTPTPVPADPPTVVGPPVRTGRTSPSGPVARDPYPIRTGRGRRPGDTPEPMTPPPPPPPRPTPAGQSSKVLLYTIPAIALVLIAGGLLIRNRMNRAGQGGSSSLTGNARLASPSPVLTSPSPPDYSPEPPSPTPIEPSPLPTRTADFLPSPTPIPTSTPRPPNPTPTPRESPRAADGLLQLVVRPWAYVAVDGQNMGTTPLRKFPVAAGSHVVVLTHPQFRALQRRVVVQPGETTLLEIDLRKEGVPLPPGSSP